ncbi:MAG: periplasmic heavy metal sensor [Elusimicrobia bacterium]|nr:periplasmic heavy metal sensor [Elusimicrobiota bacterium]
MRLPFFVMLAVVLLAAAAGPSAAQPDKGREPSPAMGPGGPGGPGGMPGLSEEQKEKLQAAMKAEREAMKPLQRQLRDAVTKLSDLIEDEAGDKELEAAMDKVEKLHKEMQAQREKSQAHLKVMLPVKQRAMMMIRMSRGMDRMREAMGQRGRMGRRGRMGLGRGGHEGDDGGMPPGPGPDPDEGPQDEEP